MSIKKPKGKKLTRKEARQMVYEKLAAALTEFKNGMKDKKFESNLRKASKLFADDMVKASKSNSKASKKTSKKKQEQKPDTAEGN
jgi:hypothetical protein